MLFRSGSICLPACRRIPARNWSCLLRLDGKISYITNNYSHISFNVGPTLHAWIARHDPTLAESLLHADRFATQALGAGGAIAQAYNHMILPLSEERDIRTQVRWGARDFEYRYGRPPRGMWLPETAVDTRTLEALADSATQIGRASCRERV